MPPELLLPPQQEVDWPEVINTEVHSQMYNYLLPKNPDVIARMVQTAVFEVLSGNEMSDGELNRAMGDSPKITQNEKTEIFARDLFEIPQRLSENKKYSDEWKEAVTQGDAARKLFSSRTPQTHFFAKYDYWQGMPMKS